MIPRKVLTFAIACAVAVGLAAASPTVASAASTSTLSASALSTMAKAPMPRPAVARVSPSSGSDTGGTRVTVTGKNFSEVRRVLFGSAAGSALKVESSTRLLVTAPRHAVGAVTVTVVTGHGDSAAGTAGRFSYTTPAEAVKWGPWKRVDGNGSGEIGAVGCLTATHCLAFDGNGSKLLSWNGSAWSAPTATKLTTGPYGRMAEMSCPTAAFCMAVGGQGNAYRYAGGTWTHLSTGTGAVMLHVSCASPTFCVATDSNSDVTEYNGKTWSKDVQLDGGTRYPDDDVSCASASFCLLTTDADAVFAWDGKSWKQTVAALPGASGQLAVSCVSGAWCLAVDGDGHAYTYNGASWTAAVAAGISGTPGNLVCTSEMFCLVGGSGGDVARYNGTSWTLSSNVFDGGNNRLNPPDLSCAGQTCVGVSVDFYDAVAFASTFAGGRWTGQTAVDKSGALDVVSCPTTSFCAAVGIGKYALTWHHGTWAAPVYLPAAVQPDNLSCPSATFCLAADSNGAVWRYNGATWTAIASPPGLPLAILGLSCAGPTFCVAAVTPKTNGQGHSISSALVAFNGSTWSSVKTWAANAAVWQSVSCPSAKFCLVSDTFGDVAAFNGKSWRELKTPYSFYGWSVVCTSATFCVTPVQPKGPGTSGVVMFNGVRWTYIRLMPSTGPSGTGPEISGATCAPRSRFCVATTSNGRVFSYNGGQWSRSAVIGGQSQDDVSCASARLCLAVDGTGDAAIGT